MESALGEKSNLDNEQVSAQTDSFWEVGKYNRAVKRCDDGNKLTTDLISMINERAELEKTFAKMLKSWSKKWSDYVTKSPEFGSMASAWKAIMSEADASAEVHQAVHDELQSDIIPSIKSWQKAKYTKSMMHTKPTKDFDEEFKRAQKPWAKLYVKVDKYKRDYHGATKNLKLAETQENSVKLDGSMPLEQRAKLSEKIERFRKEKESIKVKYMEALQELNRANPKYMDDMNEVFSRCQTFEKDRLMKFRDFFSATEKCLDLSQRLQSANFQQFSQIIKNCDADRDLSWWSDTYGAGMKMNWPTFEELNEAQKTCIRRGKAEAEREGPVVVTAIRPNNSNNGFSNSTSSADNRSSTNNAAFNEESDSTPASPYMGYHQPASAPADVIPSWATNSWGTTEYGNSDSHSSLPNYSTNNMPLYQSQSSFPSGGNPFGEEEDNQSADSFANQSSSSNIVTGYENSPGVTVRALYDYEAQEQDELSFKQGDIFTKVEDEDDQGWCKGRLGSRIGLYPATYVEVL